MTLIWEPCIDCDATGVYPSGATCKSCEGERVVSDYVSRDVRQRPTNSAGRPEASKSANLVLSYYDNGSRIIVAANDGGRA